MPVLRGGNRKIEYEKRRHAYDRGVRIFDEMCFCGKYLASYEAHVQHFKAKHPKHYRAQKKSGYLAQLRFDWPISIKERKERAKKHGYAV